MQEDAPFSHLPDWEQREYANDYYMFLRNQLPCPSGPNLTANVRADLRKLVTDYMDQHNQLNYKPDALKPWGGLFDRGVGAVDRIIRFEEAARLLKRRKARLFKFIPPKRG